MQIKSVIHDSCCSGGRINCATQSIDRELHYKAKKELSSLRFGIANCNSDVDHWLLTNYKNILKYKVMGDGFDEFTLKQILSRINQLTKH